MAAEFCPECKPNTKKKCASCPKGRTDWGKKYREQGKVEPSRRLTYPAWIPEEEEEHF